MSKKAGIWIDHKQTVIVELKEDKESVLKIDSGITEDQHEHFRGSVRHPFSSSPGESVSEDKYENKHKNVLQKYWKDVISVVKDMDQILIMGPGEAKKELESEMKKTPGLVNKIMQIETADKMTESQIKKKVCQYFGYTHARPSEKKT